MPDWTLTLNGTTRSLADWGLCDPQLEYRNQASDILSVVHDGADYDSAPIFNYLDTITLRDPQNIIRFVGRKIVTDAAAQGRSESLVYQFAGPWDYFEKLTFHQQWRDWSTQPAGFFQSSHIRIPARFDSNNVLQSLTTGGQISEVITFIRSVSGNVLQAGTIAPALQIPLQERTDQRCSEVVREMLSLTPDAICYFDYTTTPPTFHVIQRAALIAKTIALTAERITDIKLRRRDDMVPGAVVINYERTDMIDGRPRPIYVRDAFPLNSVGTEYNSVTQTVKLFGAEVVKVRGYLETLPVPATPDESWFQARGLHIASNGRIDEFAFEGRDGDLAHEIIDGQALSWMELDGVLIETDNDVFRGSYTLKLHELADADDVDEALGPTISLQKRKPAEARILTTNLDCTNGVQFEAVASSISAEPVPVGLAQFVYDSLSTVPYEGTVTLTEEEAQGDIALFHKLNISGGTGAYASMNALVQSVSIDIETGQTTVQLGPPAHLGIPDLIELLRFNRTRRVYTNAAVQESGNFANSDITLDGKPPQQNGSSNTGTVVAHKFMDGENAPYVLIGDESGEELAQHGQIKIGSTQTPEAFILLRLADIQSKAIQFREVPEVVMGANGQCTTKKRIILCSAQYE
jgi:hypothetical protein